MNGFGISLWPIVSKEILWIVLFVQIATITEVYLHPAYNYPTFLNHDFAMFRFTPPVEYNKCVAPICLPEQGYVFEPMIDTYGIGWGNLHCKLIIKRILWLLHIAGLGFGLGLGLPMQPLGIGIRVWISLKQCKLTTYNNCSQKENLSNPSLSPSANPSSAM